MKSSQDSQFTLGPNYTDHFSSFAILNPLSRLSEKVAPAMSLHQAPAAQSEGICQ